MNVADTLVMSSQRLPTLAVSQLRLVRRAHDHAPYQNGHRHWTMSGRSIPNSCAYRLHAICSFLNFSFACAPVVFNLGTRSTTSIASVKRSISLLIASSIGVLMLPRSL